MPKGALYARYKVAYSEIVMDLYREDAQLRAVAGISWEQLTIFQKNIEAVLAPEIAWTPKPRCERIFWRTLEQHDLRFTVERHPYQCRYHDEHPVIRRQQDRIVSELAGCEEEKKPKLQAQLTRLKKRLAVV